MNRVLPLVILTVLGSVFVVMASRQPSKAEAALPAPYLISPASGTILSEMTATLSWSLPQGATQIHLQVIPPNNDGPAIDIIRNAAQSYTVLAPPEWYGLLPDMTYTWRIRASDSTTVIGAADPSWSAWSASWTFRTPKVTSGGILVLSPANGATVGSLSPRFIQWSDADPRVFYYEVQVSGDSKFDPNPATGKSFVWWNIVHGDVGGSVPPKSWYTPPLESGKVYYWRVRPRVQGDGMPVAWSSTFTFLAPAVAPTPTPQPTPTPAPTPVPIPLRLVALFSGEWPGGETELFYLLLGRTRFEICVDGSSGYGYLGGNLYDASNHRVATIFNGLAPVPICTVREISLGADGYYFLTVGAAGPWVLGVWQP